MKKLKPKKLVILLLLGAFLCSCGAVVNFKFSRGGSSFDVLNVSGNVN